MCEAPCGSNRAWKMRAIERVRLPKEYEDCFTDRHSQYAKGARESFFATSRSRQACVEPGATWRGSWKAGCLGLAPLLGGLSGPSGRGQQADAGGSEPPSAGACNCTAVDVCI